jgi:hypothetical protein
MNSKDSMTRAVVLSGGGRAGAAWMLGLAAGLREVGVDLAAADLIVGTSAGARTGAQLATGAVDQAITAYRPHRLPVARTGINALLLGTLLYRSRLVPRIIPVLGLIGAPLLIAAVIATLFGGLKLGSPMPEALPVAAWELSLGVWLVVKGFRPSPITAGMATASTPLAERGAAA